MSLLTYHAAARIDTLSLHDALPISARRRYRHRLVPVRSDPGWRRRVDMTKKTSSLRSMNGLRSLKRSEEHTSELQSREKLVCRLLLEKKKNNRPEVTLNVRELITTS